MESPSGARSSRSTYIVSNALTNVVSVALPPGIPSASMPNIANNFHVQAFPVPTLHEHGVNLGLNQNQNMRSHPGRGDFTAHGRERVNSMNRSVFPNAEAATSIANSTLSFSTRGAATMRSGHPIGVSSPAIQRQRRTSSRRTASVRHGANGHATASIIRHREERTAPSPVPSAPVGSVGGYTPISVSDLTSSQRSLPRSRFQTLANGMTASSSAMLTAGLGSNFRIGDTSCSSYRTEPNQNAAALRTPPVESELHRNTFRQAQPPVPNSSSSRLRGLSRDRGLVINNGLEELITVTKQVFSQIRTWREEDALIREEDRKSRGEVCRLMKLLLDSNLAISSDLKHVFAAGGTANGNVRKSLDSLAEKASLAQNLVKYHTLLGMAPNFDSTSLFHVRADPSCDAIRVAAMFALKSSPDMEVQTFLTSTLRASKVGKSNGTSVLASISRGQSRAHDLLQREITIAFFQNCPQDSPLRTGSKASAADTANHAKLVYSSGWFKTGEEYENAWFAAALVARTKARAAAIAAADEILSVRNDADLPPIWAEDKDTDGLETLDMSICGFAFVVTKVAFALRRKFPDGATLRELNNSHQRPWAMEALKINDMVTRHGTSARMGRITFPRALTEEAYQLLSAMSQAQS